MVPEAFTWSISLEQIETASSLRRCRSPPCEGKVELGEEEEEEMPREGSAWPVEEEEEGCICKASICRKFTAVCSTT